MIREKLKLFFNNSIVRDCFKTFLQVFFGALAVTINTADLSDRAVVLSILIGAGSSGICAVTNFIMERRENNEKESNI